LVLPKLATSSRFAGFVVSSAVGGFVKLKESKNMEQKDQQTRNKGGRPKKAVKKDQLLPVKCSSYEKRIIKGRAKNANLSVSEYIREIALTGKIDRREKALPKEVLQLMGTMNHTAANLNQIAKTLNKRDPFTIILGIQLQEQISELKQITATIKMYFQ
jgi:hypothetical protein